VRKTIRSALSIAAALLPIAHVHADIVGPTGNWSNFGTWGYCYTASFGQTFLGNGEALTGFRYRVYSETCCANWPMRILVFRWDDAQQRTVGDPIASADTTFGGGCCWFDRDTNFGQRPFLQAGARYVAVMTVTPWWGQYGCPNASFAINPNYEYPDGEFVYLDNGGDPSRWSSQTWSRPGYDLNFTVRTTDDCDGNGVPDPTELGATTDCDANGALDRCEGRTPETTSVSSAQQGPIGATSATLFDFPGLIPPATSVTIRVDASGDLSASHEFCFVRIGSSIERLVFTGTEQDCTALTANVTLTREEFVAAMQGNSLRVTVAGSSTVDDAACGGASWAQISFTYANAWPDCNGNFVADSDDMCVGTSADCNANHNPDECDIASGASADLDADAQPDECQVDCNGDHRPDEWQIAIGELPDCDGNSQLDTCDISAQPSIDCNANGVPDSCDIASGASPDCDGDGKIDSCALAQNLVPDCNSNGVPDSCDVASATSADCNSNGVPDACDVASAQVTIQTPQQAPFTNGSPLRYTIHFPRPAASDVRLDIQFYGYSYGYYGQYFRPRIDGNGFDAWYDQYWGGCSSGVRATIIPRDAWNAAAADGSILLEVLHDAGSNCGGNCAVTVTYTPDPVALDCNANGIPDGCDFKSGLEHDCNENGIPDSCDIASGAEDESGNGYPDSCDLDRGDLNLDGIINGADFGLLLTYWGGVDYPIGDLNHDGIINGADLGVMLTNWGPTH
jgi:hypothetical protein